jgi:hypothetical protein
VEIDPTILELGRRMHPDDPYSDPRVSAHVADARAYLRETDARYDLILYGLAGSVATIPGQSQLRLESYLYTEEAMRDAARHLRDGGVLATYNYYRRTVLGRLTRTLEAATGMPPCVELGTTRNGRREALLLARVEANALECTAAPSAVGTDDEIVTDDRPFPYLSGRAIPSIYLVALAALLAGSALAVRMTTGRLAAVGRYADLFFMGAAFLLLETKSIVQFALLFGTTWFVNALAFGGILLAVLAAVEVASRVTIRSSVLAVALFASLAVAWAVPTGVLVGLPAVPRFVAAALLAFTPVMLANVLFAQRFKLAREPTVAFGANLLGALVGGVLEYASLVIGYRALLLVAATLYALAMISLGGGVRTSAPEPA